MNKTLHIYGLGAALVDTEIQVSDQDLVQLGVDKGIMTLVDEARQAELMQRLADHVVHAKRASGGSGANSIMAAAHFGSRCFYSCKVANDDNGRFFLQDIRAAGVEHPQHLGTEPGVTGKCLVFITPDAERTMNTYLGISEQLSPAEVDEAALAAAHWLYIEGYQVTSETGRAAAIASYELARQHGTRIALSLSDPAMVQFFREGLMAMLGTGVDLLFCNEQEALSFTQTQSLAAAAEALKAHCQAFAITCGAQGALLFDGERLMNIKATPVQAVDTNGAGDMFAGAFLFALNQGLGFERAGKLASRAAAAVVSQYGPRLSPEVHAQLLQSLDD